MTKQTKTTQIVMTAMMLAVATVLSFVCEYIPFLNLPFGGTLTIASMLPIIIVAYMYGTKWGLFTGFIFSIIQMIVGMNTVSALFIPGNDSYQPIYIALLILLIDYIIAYTVIGFGGILRNKTGKVKALCLGSVIALSLRYLAHIVSGAIFYGVWAEWFFGQNGLREIIGNTILSTFSGPMLSVIYSIIYNGMYMIPEIIITAVVSVFIAKIPQIRKTEI